MINNLEIGESKKFFRFSKFREADAKINRLLLQIENQKNYVVKKDKKDKTITILPREGLPYSLPISSYITRRPDKYTDLFKVVIQIEYYGGSKVGFHTYFYRCIYIKEDDPILDYAHLMELPYFEFKGQEKLSVIMTLEGILRGDFSFINSFLDSEGRKLENDCCDFLSLCHRIENEYNYLSQNSTSYGDYYTMNIALPSINEESVKGFLRSHYKKTIFNKLKKMIEERMPSIIDYDELDYKVSTEIFNDSIIGRNHYIPTEELEKTKSAIEEELEILSNRTGRKSFEFCQKIVDLQNKVATLKKIIEKNAIDIEL